MKKLLENEKGLSLSLKAVLKDNKTQVDSDVGCHERCCN